MVALAGLPQRNLLGDTDLRLRRSKEARPRPGPAQHPGIFHPRRTVDRFRGQGHAASRQQGYDCLRRRKGLHQAGGSLPSSLHQLGGCRTDGSGRIPRHRIHSCRGKRRKQGYLRIRRQRREYLLERPGGEMEGIQDGICLHHGKAPSRARQHNRRGHGSEQA